MAKVSTLHPATLLQLRIELKYIEPKIWRELVVPDTITLARLHDVIQAAMGWTDSHLHEFEINGRRYGVPDPDWDFDRAVISENRVKLTKALAGRKTFTYLYDFGDGWEHKVALKKTLINDGAKKQAMCLGGANACPPEDVGGPYGYVEYITAISDKAHPEHDQMIEWRGPGFNPAAFNVNETNEILSTIKV